MSNFKSKLFAAFDKIGTSNGTAVPKSQDPLVSFLHEYHVATLGESYFKKRREQAKAKLGKQFGPTHVATIDKTIASVKKNEVSQTEELMQTDPYTLVIDVKTGASFLDVAALKVTLARKHKLSMTEVEELIEECTDRREPSQGWKVVER